MGIIIAMGIFFIFITMIFVAVAYFLPEWLGITGKKAKEIMAEQVESLPQEHGLKEVPPPQTKE